jgi:ribonuclease G
MKEILINVGSQEHRVVILDDNRLDEFFIERVHERTIVGNIYKGRVDSIVHSLNAAFVDIGLPKKGFLYLTEGSLADFAQEDIDELELADSSKKTQTRQELKVGQEILAQVVKEQFGTKGPRLTTKISLPGRYLVLMPGSSNIGISRRIEEDSERKRLKALMESLRLPNDFGFVVRTVSVGAQHKQLQRDAKFLLNLWSRVSRFSSRKKAPALVHPESDLIMRIVRDSFSEDVSSLIIDSKREFYTVRRFVRIYSPSLLRRIQLHRTPAPLFERFKVEEKIEEIYDRKVSLKSGGYLYIEPTEGLVVIDVNSGKFRGHSSASGPRAQEEMAFSVNMEAAGEIARQVRLRDLGGLIVIDFIDMTKEGHRRQLLDHFKKLLRHDRAKTDVIRISEFGIVEMTRQRQRRSAESVAFQLCPYCQGRGKVKSVTTVAISLLRILSQAIVERKKRKLLVSLHPEVVEYLNVHYKKTLDDLQNRFKTSVILNPSPHLHLEKIIIE